MSVLKKYNELTAQWEPAVIGKQGPSGVINVSAPITNTGTTTSAVIGIDQSAISLSGGVMKNWNLGQPSVAAITSNGANCYTFKIRKSAMYYQGFIWDVYMNGGKDWGGHGYATYYAKMMVTFTSTSAARVHVIQEFSRSYIDNSNTEIIYNTNSATSDADFFYLTINYRNGITTADGFRPVMHLITYDPKVNNGAEVSQIHSVYAV